MPTTFHFKPEMVHLLTWFDDSPDAGDPECVCSYCGEVIGSVEGDDEDSVPLRIWGESSNKELRLHMRCARVVVVELALPVAMQKAPAKEYKDHPSYLEGWNAFEDATRRGANPYATKGPEASRSAWFAGWDAAWRKYQAGLAGAKI